LDSTISSLTYAREEIDSLTFIISNYQQSFELLSHERDSLLKLIRIEMERNIKIANKLKLDDKAKASIKILKERNEEFE
jgi:hypothetical protein